MMKIRTLVCVLAGLGFGGAMGMIGYVQSASRSISSLAGGDALPGTPTPCSTRSPAFPGGHPPRQADTYVPNPNTPQENTIHTATVYGEKHMDEYAELAVDGSKVVVYFTAHEVEHRAALLKLGLDPTAFDVRHSSRSSNELRGLQDQISHDMPGLESNGIRISSWGAFSMDAAGHRIAKVQIGVADLTPKQRNYLENLYRPECVNVVVQAPIQIGDEPKS